MEGNPPNWTDPSGRCVDPLSFWLCAAVGGAIIGGVTGAAYNVMVHQGVGLGGANQGNFSAVDWDQAGRVGSFGAGLGAEIGINAGAGVVAGSALRGLVTAGRISQGAAFALGAAADVGFGVGWDMLVHHNSPTDALINNALFFGVGEAVGYAGRSTVRIAGKVLRSVDVPTRPTQIGRGGVLPPESEVIPHPSMASQELTDSCVPACVRELLRRQNIVMSEREVIDLIDSDEMTGATYGAWNRVESGINTVSSLKYTNRGNFETQEEALRFIRGLNAPWIASVGKPGSNNHAVIIESVTGTKLLVSDPWAGQPSVGSAVQYSISWNSFYQHWRYGFFVGLYPK